MPPGVLLDINNLDYFLPTGGTAENDSGYNMGLDPTFDRIPHTANTLTIEWFASGGGWNGGVQESWAIEDVEVILNIGLPAEGILIEDITIADAVGNLISDARHTCRGRPQDSALADGLRSRVDRRIARRAQRCGGQRRRR